jgi:hypothetical protein
MNNKAIRTYEDLEKEEQRLTGHLATLKVTIKDDIQEVKAGVKDKLNPIKKAKNAVHNMLVRDSENGKTVNFLLNFVMDFFIRLFIPKRANVVTKTVIPFLTKNYVSHLITDEQRESIRKAVNGATGKVDQFIQNMLKKKQEAKYDGAEKQEPEITKVEPVFVPVNNVDTNPMNL